MEPLELVTDEPMPSKNPEEVIPYTPQLDIRNIEALPRGTGARFLVVIKGQGDELVAKRWARGFPKNLSDGEIVVDMNPAREA